MNAIVDLLRRGRQKIRSLQTTAEGFQSDLPVKLSTIGEFRKEAFPDCGPYPWLDRPDALAKIADKLADRTISAEEAALCMSWVKDGYVVIENLFSPEEVAAVWKGFERDHPQSLDAHLHCAELNQLIHDARLLDLCSLLLGRSPIAFQSIVRKWGSQQAAHSDAIHMTTHPIGYLVAAWVALEDIHPHSGPLFYYPGSHRLPYFLSREAGIDSSDHRKRPYKAYTEKYEPFIEAKILEHGLERKTFTPKAGSVLLWHHNLVHGGSTIEDRQRTRKDVVFHYFSQNVVCYHDLSGALAARRK